MIRPGFWHTFFEEAQHSSALTLFESSSRKLTHSYVLVELVALAHARKYRRTTVLEFLHDLFDHPQVEIIWGDETLTREALFLLEQRKEKGYLLCNAVRSL